MKKKIVIISYAAYPSQAPRSLRTTELAKGFAKAGYDTTLYVLTGEYDYSSFEKETNVKIKSLGPTCFIQFDHKRGTHYSIATKIIKKLFGRFLEFPSIELIRNVTSVLRKEKDIDLLISIAVPFPLHWGVALSKHRHPNRFRNTTWVADCGDPYMGNPFHKRPFYFKYVEKWFCEKADYLSVPVEGAKEAYYPEFTDKIKVIPQGFDFGEINLENNYKGNSVPTFIYAGVFYEDHRDPRPFLNYLLTVTKDFKFIIYTRSQRLLKNYLEPLNGKLVIHDYIPRKELLTKLSQADFLINFENPSAVQSPSKLIDYFIAQRPVLNINTNESVDYHVFLEFMIGDYTNKIMIEDIDKFKIENITNLFIDLQLKL